MARRTREMVRRVLGERFSNWLMRDGYWVYCDFDQRLRFNDWDTFWVVPDHPELPLMNNEAERALRHWVITRCIGMGTRTPQGTRHPCLRVTRQCH